MATSIAPEPLTFDKQGYSPYLRAMLDPMNAQPTDIPDDRSRLHTRRAEVVTYNAQAGAAGRGVFILWPNHPTTLVGSYFTLDANNQPTFVSNIRLAQDLTQYYDWVRKGAAGVHIQTTTIPAAGLIPGGTFNGIRIEGPLSELLDPAPNQLTSVAGTINPSRILGKVANNNDKIGNQICWVGIDSIMIPSEFNYPYIQFDSRTVNSNGEMVVARSSSSFSLHTECGWPIDLNTLIAGTNALGTRTVPIDSTSGVICVGLLKIKPTLVVPTSTALTARVTFSTKTLGNVETDRLTVEAIAFGDGTVNSITFKFFTSKIGMSALQPDLAPTVAVQMTATIYASAGCTLDTTQGWIGFDLESIDAAHPGMTTPTTVITYEGLATNTGTPPNLLVSGVSLLELIPNKEVRATLPLDYGYSNPHEMDYVRRVLANRDQLGIRSLWKSDERAAALERHLDYANRMPTDVQHAFSISDLLGVLRQAVPVAGAIGSLIAPEFSPLIGAATGLADSILGTANASGGLGKLKHHNRRYQHAMSATSTATDFSQLNDVHELDENPLDLQVLVQDALGGPIIEEPEYRMSHDNSVTAPYPLAEIPVLFPTIGSHNGELDGSTMFWGVVQGLHENLIGPDSPNDCTATWKVNGQSRTVLGLPRDLATIFPHLPIAHDLTIFPIAAYAGDGISVLMHDVPALSGLSMTLACLFAGSFKTPKTKPVALTGEVAYDRWSKQWLAIPVLGMPQKRLAAQQAGITLVSPLDLAPRATSVKAGTIFEHIRRISENIAYPMPNHSPAQLKFGGTAHAASFDDWVQIALHPPENSDPEILAVSSLMNWLLETDTAELLIAHRERDPDGRKLHNFLSPETAVAPPTRVTDVDGVPSALKAQYGASLTPAWWAANKKKGPTQLQARYFSASASEKSRGERRLPDPSLSDDQLLKRIADFYASRMVQPLLNMPGFSKARFEEELEAVIRLRNGAGPTQDDMKRIIASSRGKSTKQPTTALNRLRGLRQDPRLRDTTLEEEALEILEAPTQPSTVIGKMPLEADVARLESDINALNQLQDEGAVPKSLDRTLIQLTGRLGALKGARANALRTGEAQSIRQVEEAYRTLKNDVNLTLRSIPHPLAELSNATSMPSKLLD